MANQDITILIAKIVEDIEIVLDHFNIEYTKYHDRIAFTCPIHGSDNDESLCIYLNPEDPVSCNWLCWTNHCEEEILSDGKPLGKFVLGLIRGLLGVQKQREVSYGEAIKFVLMLYGIDNKALEGKYNDPDYKDKQNFIKETKHITKKKKIVMGNIPRDQVRSSLNIPSQYFMGRGFSEAILNSYDVGYCKTKGKEMTDRVVVPIYDEQHVFMVGFV